VCRYPWKTAAFSCGFMWDVFGDRTLYGITKPFPSIDVRSCYQVRNMMLKVLDVDFDWTACQFALLYSGIFLDDWLCRGGWMLALIMTASWSLRPGIIVASWICTGKLVKNKSNIFAKHVGSLITYVRPWSCTTSTSSCWIVQWGDPGIARGIDRPVYVRCIEVTR